MDKLLDCEEKLLSCRQELNVLMREYYGKEQAANPVYEGKLNELQREAASLAMELETLRRQMGGQPAHAQSVAALHPTYVQPQSAAAPHPTYVQPQSAAAPHPTYVQAQSAASPQPAFVSQQYRTAPPKKKRDWELILGRSLMGIFASVLIFISLVLFATLILPKLSDTVKMVLMYLVSLVFLGVGLFLLKKDKESRLYQALTGCGLGAVYISLLVSNLYFKALGDIPLYLFIFVWAVFVFFLSKNHSVVFQVIGQAGILISVIFGTALCVNTKEWDKFLFLTGYFVLSELLFLLGNWKKDYEKNMISLGAILFGLAILRCVDIGDYFLWMDPCLVAAFTILLAFDVAIFAISFVCFHVKKEYSALFAISQMLYLLLATICYVFAYGELFFMALAIFSIVTMEWRCGKQKLMGRLFLRTVLFGVLLWCCNKPASYKGMGAYYLEQYNMAYTDLLYFGYEYIYVSVFAAAFALYGYSRKKISYQVAGIVYLGVFALNSSMSQYANFGFGLLLFLLFGYLIRTKQQYFMAEKMGLYLLFLAFLTKESIWLTQDVFMVKNRDLRTLIPFAVLAVAHMASSLTFLPQNWETGEREKKADIFGGILHGILMIIALWEISVLNEGAPHFVAVVLAVALFAVNSGRLLKMENPLAGVYVGAKFTLLLFTVLFSYGAADFVSSICYFVFAILCIGLGFFVRQKALRIYGLVISLISVAKLVLVDIHYGNTTGRAFSFFICGLLCFAISVIYQYVDKKMARE